MELNAQETVEFYAPFAHIPGVYEVCRIHTVEYGSFDTAIIIHQGTDRPVTVYVNEAAGERFMAERFPESSCIRVDADGLTITASPDGRTVRLDLTAATGPLLRAELAFTARPGGQAEAAPYGDSSFPVWGSRYSCRGIDLNLPARAVGHVTLAPESFDSSAAAAAPGATLEHGVLQQRTRHQAIDRQAIIALGSIGILAPRQ